MSIVATALGAAATATTTTALTISTPALAAGASAGTLVCATCIVNNNSSTFGATPVTDSKGNAYQYSTGAGLYNGTNIGWSTIAYCVIPDSGHALTTSDTITLTLSATAASLIIEATAYSLTSGTWVPTATVLDAHHEATGSSAALSSGTSSATTNADDLIVGAHVSSAAAGTFTSTSPATKNPKTAGTPIANSNMILFELYGEVVATGTQESHGTEQFSSGFSSLVAAFIIAAAIPDLIMAPPHR